MSDPFNRSAPRKGGMPWRWLCTTVVIFFVGVWVHSLELHKMLLTEPQGHRITPRPTSVHVTMAGDDANTTAAVVVDSGAVQRARAAADALLQELVQRAPKQDYRSFDDTMPAVGSERTLVAKMVHALLYQREYVIGTVGTSNAACHDSTMDECFPAYFASDMRRLFGAMNVRVDLVNHAMGGINSLMPSMCLKTMIGEDVDVLLYEFLMSDAGLPCAPKSHEMLIRAGLRLEKQPIIHFVEIEGGRRKEQEVNGKIEPRPEGAFRDDHFTHYYFRPLREHYRRFNVHHMQMLDGLFAIDHIPEFRYEYLFATFHPSAAGHRYLADQLAYYHTKAFIGALDQIEEMVAQYNTRIPYLQRPILPLPDPIYCEKEWCDADELPFCVTSYQPRRIKSASIAVNFGDMNVPYLNSASEALEHKAEDFEETKATGWERVLAKGEKLHADRGYLDFKLVWQAKKGAESKKFSIHVPQGGVGIIVICQSPPIWGEIAPGHISISEPDAITVKVDGYSSTPRLLEELAGIAQCGNGFSDICVAFGDKLKAGLHTLEITPNNELYIVISQIIGI